MEENNNELISSTQKFQNTNGKNINELIPSTKKFQNKPNDDIIKLDNTLNYNKINPFCKVIRRPSKRNKII